jgi:putative Mg2+ transporter-C (MgtC) family protein
MVGTFAGGGYYALSLGAAFIVVLTNIALRPAILGINRRLQSAADREAETQYTIAVTCHSSEEAHVRTLLLHALSQGGLGLRRIVSEDPANSGKVRVTAETPAGERKDRALEDIVGRLSLGPFVTAVSWEAQHVNGDG